MGTSVVTMLHFNSLFSQGTISKCSKILVFKKIILWVFYMYIQLKQESRLCRDTILALFFVGTLFLQCTHFRAEQLLFKLKRFVLLRWLKRSPTELDTDAFWILHFPLWIMIQLGSLVHWVGWFLTTREPLQNLFSIMPRPTCSENPGPIILVQIWARYS